MYLNYKKIKFKNILSMIIIAFTLTTSTVKAVGIAPPTGGYTPDLQVIDPDCSQGDPDCYVNLNQSFDLGDLANLDTVGTAQIDTGAVTNNELAQMNASTVKGRLSDSGIPEDIAMTDLPISNATQLVLDDKLNSVVGGTNITIDNTDPNNPVISSSGGGGAGNPAGNNTEVQFNNNGVFGSSSDLTFDNDKLSTRDFVQTFLTSAPNDDLNDLTGNRFFRSHTATTNAPVNSFGMGMNLEYSSGNTLQIMGNRGVGELYARWFSNGSTVGGDNGWHKIWNERNFEQSDIDNWDEAFRRWNGDNYTFNQTDIFNAFFNTGQFPTNSPSTQNPTLFPPNTFYSGINVMYAGGSATNPSGWQLVSSRGNNSPLAYRKVVNGNLNSWKYLWDSNNVPEENINTLDDIVNNDHVFNSVKQGSLSSDPADPSVGETVQWVSDGTGSGDAGDVMIKINVGGTVKTTTLIDYSAI